MASDDDVYESNFLEEIDKLTIKYPKVDLFRGRMKKIDEVNRLWICDAHIEEYLDHLHFLYQFYTSNMLTCEANYVYRTEGFRHKDGYVDFPLAWFADDATHIIMAEKGCVNTSEIVFSYRISPLAISSKCGDVKDSIEKIKASLNFWAWISNYVLCMKDSEELGLKSLVLRKCKEKVVLNIEKFIKFLNLRDAYKYINMCSKKLGMSKVLLIYMWLHK